MNPETTTTPTTATEPILVSIDQTCEMLGGIHKTHIYHLINSGKIPLPIRLGRRTLWRADELRAWVAAGCPQRKQWQVIRGQR